LYSIATIQEAKSCGSHKLDEVDVHSGCLIGGTKMVKV